MSQSSPLSRSQMYKSKRPSWRESLKDRCKIEMKRRRNTLLSQLRSCNVESSVVDDIMYKQYLDLRKEMKYNDFPESDKDLSDLFEELREEILLEQSYFDTGDFYFDDIISSVENVDVICPICQKYNLSKQGDTISCHCGVELQNKPGLELRHIHDSLSTAAELHSARCCYIPLFVCEVDPETYESCITMKCNYCVFLYHVVK